ncbi:MAG: hypothetical protein R3324_11615, partial [Halobacteriales archaeon]|nr:hypothetical protein [Halobacteriales archaeon]
PGRGREVTVVEALEVGVARVRDELAGRPELQAAMLGTIADVYANLDDPVFQSTLEAWKAVIDAAPTVEVDTTYQTVQYSDHVMGPAITVRDLDSTPSLTLDGGAPVWVSLSAPDCETFDNGVDDGVDGYECTWTLTGTADAPAGTYAVPFTASDASTEISGSTDVAVITEDAAVTYPGNPVSGEVDEPGGDSGPFTVGVAIVERQPDDPTGSAAAGDIGNVMPADVDVELVPVGPGSTVTGACTAGSVVQDGYAGSLPITCDFDDVPVNTYAISVAVSGDYYAGGGEDVLTVFDPSLGFTTGGGWLSWPDGGEKTNFGFTISYNKKATNVRGSFLLIRHLDDGSVYRVKSNAIEGLSVGEEPDFGWASFTTKATYRDPSMAEPEGNYEVTAYVEDREAGDRLWLQVRDRDGMVVDDLSLDTPAPENTVAISAGEIVVPQRRGRGPTAQ